MSTATARTPIKRLSVRNLPPDTEINGVTVVYVGRGSKRDNLAGHPLQNRFTVKKYGKGVACDMYRKWLWEKIKANDPVIMCWLGEIRLYAHAVVCWCDEGYDRCHADVIIRAIEYLDRVGWDFHRKRLAH